ncbi:MAG: RES family NAD+ phosphorylase [Gammaproteobacteria bacterium]|nr:RES family NAD+ phosphorylase [Gammaproteobacteria bacterium]
MWTATALASETYPARGTIWRVVEHQHTASTRKLVGTISEQELLESLLETSKPPYPPGTENLHYLLKTPFRYYPPYPHGSRFRRAGITAGVFYASMEKRTAMAEMAWFRLRFFQDAPGCVLPKQEHKLTAFAVSYQTEREINLQRPPLNRDLKLWTDNGDYSATQQLAEEARRCDIESIRYLSIRDPGAGSNLALLSYTAFVNPEPETQQTWYMHFSDIEVQITRASQMQQAEHFVFQLDQLSATTEPSSI